MATHCVGANSRKRLSLQAKNERRAKLERTPIKRAVDGSYRRIILPKAVPCFSYSFRLRICDQFRFKRAAIPPVALLTRHFLSLASFSASRSTISRVINSFSKCVLPQPKLPRCCSRFSPHCFPVLTASQPF